jgi:hypothetical protein
VTGGRYAFRVKGRLSAGVRGAFPTMDITEIPTETVITGMLGDEEVHEILELIQDLGLHVVSVQRVIP